MLVISAPSVKVPMEGMPRRYIEQTPVEVPDTPYYRRRITEGDLVMAPASRTTTKATAVKKEASNDQP